MSEEVQVVGEEENATDLMILNNSQVDSSLKRGGRGRVTTSAEVHHFRGTGEKKIYCSRRRIGGVSGGPDSKKKKGGASTRPVVEIDREARRQRQLGKVSTGIGAVTSCSLVEMKGRKYSGGDGGRPYPFSVQGNQTQSSPAQRSRHSPSHRSPSLIIREGRGEGGRCAGEGEKGGAQKPVNFF